jgi:hypothetical protein
MIAARILRQWPTALRRQAVLARCFSKTENKNTKSEQSEESPEELEKEFKDEILSRDGLQK